MVKNKNPVEIGKYVKTKFSFIGKNKGRELWKAGVVVDCYTYFAVVEFERFKKSYAYDEIEIIDECEYKLLMNQNTIKNALIFQMA